MLNTGLNAKIIFIFILGTYVSCTQDSDSRLVNALVNGITGNTKLIENSQQKSTNVVANNNAISAEEANTITVIMNTLLPSMFGLFSNITSEDYKSNFKDPCRFDALMELFKQLPPYFDVIAQKYPNQPDLIAYYSMQLASTFLVNNGSLTMECMYNMLSLQTRLNSFSLDIMDNPEKNPKLVGLFGIFMKPIMKMLKKNAMMKIIEHVDRYDKNDDRENIVIFHVLNFFFIILGCLGILSNLLLILLLRRSSIANKDSIKPDKSLKTTDTLKPNVSEREQMLPSTHTHSLRLNRNLKKSHMLIAVNEHQQPKTTLRKKKPLTPQERREAKLAAEYKSIKTHNRQMYYHIRKRYKTRICFILIAICHSMYILINFIIMSQASLAAVSLKGLSQFNLACKLAFFLFPPTTAYNILHQFAMWLLVYAIREHGRKLRRTRTFDPDLDADHHDLNLMKSDSTLNNVNEYAKPPTVYDESSGDEDEDTVSVSLTNNSNNAMVNSQSQVPSAMSVGHSSIIQQEKSNQSINNNYHQINKHMTVMNNSKSSYAPVKSTLLMNSRHPYLIPLKTQVKPPSEPSMCALFARKRSNAMFCLILFILLCVYNSHNLFLYSLAKLVGKKDTVHFCAFSSDYAQYYSILTQLIIPLTNLCLFSILPLLLCTAQVLFDACFLVRVQREQMKRYEKLREVIEWPLYFYFALAVFSQAPFALHQVIDLCVGTVKFPFVFPLFIQMKFTSKIWLSVFEMVSMFLACAADFYIWILCDREMKALACNWINKRLCCRTYEQKKKVSGKGVDQTSSPSSNSGNNSRASEVDSGSTSSSFSSSNRSDSPRHTKHQNQQQKNSLIYNVKHPHKIEHVEHVQTAPIQAIANSYATPNIPSTSIGLGGHNLNKPADTAAATAKAAAAISASMQPPSIYDNFNKTTMGLAKNESPTYSNDTEPSCVSPPNNGIKMIDTDIDDIDDIDLDLNSQNNNNNLARLYEDKDLEQPPPSFNSAVRKLKKSTE